VIEHLGRRLAQTHGALSLSQREDETGYTARHLRNLSLRHIGLPPKRLARILRFQQFYTQWAQNPQRAAFRLLANDPAYYDQAHFVREFRAFTGQTLTQLTLQGNEFGRLFYRQ